MNEPGTRPRRRFTRWKILTLAALAVATAAVVTASVWSAQLPQEGSDPRHNGAAREPSAPPTERSDLTRVAVISDSFTAGSGMDSGPASRWPELLASKGFDVAPYAVSGTGYAATLQTTSGTSNFVTRIADISDDNIQRLVFFGSINDGFHDYETVHDAAAIAYSTAKDRWPDAQILVIGPASPSWPVPDRTITARDAVRDAAADADITFVDPIEESWFEDQPDLIGMDTVHPTDEGHEYLSTHLNEIFVEHFAQ